MIELLVNNLTTYSARCNTMAMKCLDLYCQNTQCVLTDVLYLRKNRQNVFHEDEANRQIDISISQLIGVHPDLPISVLLNKIIAGFQIINDMED